MNKANSSWLEHISRKWWLFLVLAFLSFIIPSYTALPFNPAETPKMVIEVLSNPLIYSVPAVFPFFKLIPIALIISLFFLGDRMTRVFDAYIALTMFLFATLQNMANTASYGFVVLTGNLVVYSLLGILWVWETVVKKNDFTPRARPAWKFWVVPVALLAFWFPMSIRSGTPSPDFSPLKLIANEGGLTFCMMIPVYLAVLTIFYPRVNGVVLRITGFIGMVTGLLNVAEFFMNASYGWWMGVLHLPLLSISIYAFALSLKKPKTD